MYEVRKLPFSDPDMRLYGKLDAASHDLRTAAGYADFMLKKAWNAKPWSRGHKYLQQSAFVTAMVVSYWRAFANSDGWPPIPSEVIVGYGADEKLLHEKIRRLRNKIYAHSDSISFSVVPVAGGDFNRWPTHELVPSDVTLLLEMCSKANRKIFEMMRSIKERYS